jgi:hypothetical protein
MEVLVATKLISSTEAQNNFGRLLDDVVQFGTRYIIQRREQSQAVVLGLKDFQDLLSASQSLRAETVSMVRQMTPYYALGQDVFFNRSPTAAGSEDEAEPRVTSVPEVEE